MSKKPRVFRTKRGAQIIVGRNARQNDELCASLAEENVLWFHVKDRPGPHVFLLVGEDDDVVDEEDVAEAAAMAVKYSKVQEHGRVGQGRVGQSRVGQSRVGQSRVGQSRVECTSLKNVIKVDKDAAGTVHVVGETRVIRCRG